MMAQCYRARFNHHGVTNTTRVSRANSTYGPARHRGVGPARLLRVGRRIPARRWGLWSPGSWDSV